ncbi:30S ribosomal protein S4e [Candidatus Woesearchaeota archaeon]|nr:30S ribosomal protein S4e [Candidatus Woesearchaeota archaeon]
MKRIRMPWFWQVDRKDRKFITRPCPGPHSIEKCMTVDLMLREFLKVAKTRKEINYILNNGKVMVDKKKVKDNHFPIGFMDVVELPEINAHYRIMLDGNGRFKLLKIKKDDADSKFCKIINKTILKKNRVQLNLVDGNNVIVEKDGYKAGDSIVIDLNTKKIKKHIKFEKGAVVALTAGKHIGNMGVVEKINTYEGMRKTTVMFKGKEESFETLKEYCYAIDDSIRDENERD